ncbi:MAG: hypothetical protein ACLFWR_13300 [Acidimicrobiales bacterium]
MKVTMKTLYATPQRVVQPGQTVDLDRKVARRLIETGDAVKASADPATHRPERTAAAAPDDGGEQTADDGDEQADATADSGLRAELEQLDRPGLVERAKAAEVKASGRSADIIDRIVEAETGDTAWTDDA